MKARTVALLLSAVMLFYFVVLGERGLTMVRDGRPVFVLLGIGVLALPLIGAWVLWRELSFGAATQRLAAELEAQDRLPVDDLPRTEKGRIDRAAADAVFVERKAEVDAAPGDWRGWYRLAVAYGDAGDTSRGRRAMRTAIALRSGRTPASQD